MTPAKNLSLNERSCSELLSDCSVNLQTVGVSCSLKYTEMKTKGLPAHKVVIRLNWVDTAMNGYSPFLWPQLHVLMGKQFLSCIFIQVKWPQGRGVLCSPCCSTLLTTLRV